MKPITVFLVLAISGLAYSAPTGSDVVAQILKAIQGNQDLTRVADYMEDFGDGFRKILPAVGPDGKKNVYTFFFPTSSTFMRQLPQDVADPFFLDEEFRNNVFRRHVVQRLVSLDDLNKLDKLVMADSKEAILTRAGGVKKINNAEILKDVIQLPNGAGTIYIINEIFMSGEEVSAVLTKNAHKFTAFGPLGIPLNP